MSKSVIERYFCDFCETELLTREPVRWSYGRKVCERNGIKITLGYSDDGWGRRSDVVQPFSSDHICDKCMINYKEKALKFWESLKIKKENK